MSQTENKNAIKKETLAPATRRKRLQACIVLALPAAMKTGLWLLSVTVPVSFGVLLLKVTGMLDLLTRLFEPLFSLFGLPGESALVFATAALLNVYSCIAVIETLGLTGRVVTILALMCLISHNLPIESAVQKKTGSSFLSMTIIRILTSFTGAAVLNFLLPADTAQAVLAGTRESVAVTSFAMEFKIWVAGMAWLCGKIMVLVTILMIVQRILEEFGIIHFLSRILKYPLIVLGIPPEAAFLWIVANTIGLGYGAGVIIDHVDRGKLSLAHANILNHHIAISHSLLEDTLLFVAIGVSAWWIIVPRVILAGIVVWLKRLSDWVIQKRRLMDAPDEESIS